MFRRQFITRNGFVITADSCNPATVGPVLASQIICRLAKGDRINVYNQAIASGTPTGAASVDMSPSASITYICGTGSPVT